LFPKNAGCLEDWLLSKFTAKEVDCYEDRLLKSQNRLRLTMRLAAKEAEADFETGR